MAAPERNIILRLIATFAPPDPGRLIPPEVLEELRPQIKAIEFRIRLVLLAVLLALVYPGTWAIVQVVRLLDGPADAVVYSNHEVLGFVEPGLVVALGLAWLSTRGVLGLLRRGEMDLYDRYTATRYGCDGWRAQLAVVVVLLGIGAVMAGFKWQSGDTIGPAGVRCHLLFPHLRSFSEVAEVRVVWHGGYHRLEIGFDDGKGIELDEADHEGLKVEKIATYVAQHAGLPLIHDPP